MTLNELSQIDNEFANAVKMMVLKAHLDGQSTLPLDSLINSLTKLGFSAAGQQQGIRNFIVAMKNKNPDLIADVSNQEIVLTTMPSAEEDQQDNADKVNNMARKYSRQELGL